MPKKRVDELHSVEKAKAYASALEKNNASDEQILSEQFQTLMGRVGGRAAAAEIMGVGVTTVDNYRLGKTQPRFLELVKLATAAQVSVSSLYSPQRQGLLTPTTARHELVTIPRYDLQASMGAGRLVAANSEVADYMPVDRDWLRQQLPPWAPPNSIVGVLEGSGDSMEPTIRDGDLLMFVQNVDWSVVSRGGIFIFSLNGMLLLKRLQVLRDGSLRIISDNPIYDPEVIAAGDLEHAGLIIHGQVFFVGGKPRSFAAASLASGPHSTMR